MSAPTVEAARAMGWRGSPPDDAEARAFMAWMQGHQWVIGGAWNGETFTMAGENAGYVDPWAMQTRMMWAAWRDRAALGRLSDDGAELDRLRAQVADLKRELQDFQADTACEDRCRSLEADLDRLRAEKDALRDRLAWIEAKARTATPSEFWVALALIQEHAAGLTPNAGA